MGKGSITFTKKFTFENEGVLYYI